MAEQEKPTYGLEPDDPGDADAPGAGEDASEASPDAASSEADDASSNIEVSRGVEALPLEEIDLSSLPMPAASRHEDVDKPTFEIEEPDDPDYIDTLDICPNCGKHMGKTRNLICMRCGYDIKTMQVIKIKTGVTTEEEERAKQPRRPKRLCKATKLDPWLPAALFGGAMLIMLIGYVMAAPGIPTIDETGPFKGVLIEIGLVLLWCAATSGALFAQSKLLERPLGDVELMLMRVAALVGVSRIPTLIEAPNWIEFPFEWSVQVLVALPLSMYFFRLKWRDALLFMAIAVLIYLPVRGITTLL